MEVTALCITVLMNVLFLLCVSDQRVDSVFLRVIPNQLQFFEYESLSLHCEGFHDSTGWKIAHQFKKESCIATNELTSADSSCILKNAYPEDSGEYWCEDEEGSRGDSVNIIITDGPVILESPVLPLKGETVTLRCRNKMASSNLPADFYKDGFLIRSSFTGNVTIHRVSKCDEGLYKCRISGAGESAESWLTVREETPTDHKDNVSPVSTPLIICTVISVFLLLVVGLFHLTNGPRRRVMLFLSTQTSGPAEHQTVSVDAGGEGAADADNPTYAVVRKNNKKKDGNELSTSVCYTLDEAGQQEPRVSSIVPAPATGTNPRLTQGSFYSTIQTVPK